MKKKGEFAIALALLGAASALCLKLMKKAGEWLDEDQKKADPIVVDRDEMLRPGTNMETLSKLHPVVGGVVTAGNSSPLNDGAAAGIMMQSGLKKSVVPSPVRISLSKVTLTFPGR